MAKKKQWENAMDVIAKHGTSFFTREQLKQLGVSIMREARKRKKELEMGGYTDSPAYRYLISNKVSFSVAGKDRNTIQHNIREAYGFLNAKTSTVEGAKNFLKTTIDRWVGKKTTAEERKAIFDVYHRLEQIHPGYFQRDTYSSGELSADVYDIYSIVSESNFDVDDAIARILEAEEDPFEDVELMGITARWSGEIKRSPNNRRIIK